MHTPAEARELWCPMVRIARRERVVDSNQYDQPVGSHDVVVAGCNTDALNLCGGRRAASDHQPLASCRCIADKCAMWRWAPSQATHTERQVVQGLLEFVGGGVEMGCAEHIVQVPDAPTYGYCGLAGRPELA